MAHHWEEPCISGTRGSGTVFFSGCALRCCFCQNAAISLGAQGCVLELQDLARAIVRLADQDVHNISLVTASHYTDRIPRLAELLAEDPAWAARPLPLVWNSSAYETVASLRQLEGIINVFLPDFKYADAALAADLAQAPDYFEVAGAAVLEMVRQQPAAVFDDAGLLRRGVLVRHLVLPGQWRDSCRVLDFLAANLPLDLPLSLMSQYTPQPQLAPPRGHAELRRCLTTLEYQKVIDYALAKGFTRLYGQERTSADAAFTPAFLSGSGAPGSAD
jgi:putative pyruvate formate lyase activating enzyme